MNTPHESLTRRRIGIALIALGLVVLASWGQQYAPLLTILAGAPPMVVNSAIGFMLAGLALALRWTRPGPAQGAGAVGVTLVGLLHLPETLFGLDLGLDHSEWHSWLAPHSGTPGRMALATSVALSVAGVALWVAPRPCGSAKRSLVARGLTFVVFAVAAAALLGYVFIAASIVAPSEYDSIPVPTALAVLALAWGLHTGIRDTSPRPPPSASEERDIVAVGTWSLIVVAVAAAVPGYVLLQRQTQKARVEVLSVMVRGRAESIANAAQQRTGRAAVVSRSSSLAASLERVRDGHVDPETTRAVDTELRTVGEGNFHALRVLDDAGTVLASFGAPDRTALAWVRMGAREERWLAWDGHLILRTLHPIDTRRAGPRVWLVAEQDLWHTSRALLHLDPLGATAQMHVCDATGSSTTCLPLPGQHANDSNLATLLRSPAAALPGIADGFDERGSGVLTAFMNIGATGPVAAITVNAADFYRPFERPFHIAMTLLMITIGLGSWLLRSRVRPLMARLHDAQVLAIAHSDAAQESEAMQRSVFDEAPNAILVVNRDGAIIQSNERASLVFGYEPDAFRRLRVEDLLPSNARDGHVALRHGFLRTQRLRAMGAGRSLRALRSDGHEFPVEVLLSPLRGGPADLVVVTVLDVSERVAVDVALRASEQRFRSMMENAPIGMALVAPDGRFLEVNAAFCRMLGRDRGAFLRGDFQSLTHPDDLAEDLANVQRLLHGKSETYRMQKRYIHGDGKTVWTDLSVSLVRDERGQPVHFVSQIQDITAELRARELRNELMAFQSALLKVDRISLVAGGQDGRIRLYSRGAEKMFGYGEREIIGHMTPLLFHDAAEIRHGPAASDVDVAPIDPTDGQQFWQLSPSDWSERREWTFVRKDGSRFPGWLTVAPIRDADDLALGYLCIVTDISDVRQKELQIATALREKEVLLKEVYHRVKNNLQVVSSLLWLQARDAQEPITRAALRESISRVRAMALVHEKLYQSENLSSIRLDEYVTDLCRHLAETNNAGTRGIAIVNHSVPLTAGIEAVVPLGLLLNELITNSLKHGFPEGRHGVITVTLSTDDDEHTVLSVADDGVGFRPEIDPSHSPSLGLRLIRSLAGQAGGTVTTESRHGVRTTVRFRIDGDVAARAAA